MSRMWASSYVQSSLRFARRNGGKIALFSFAAGSAIVAATYMRRQFSAVNDSIREERAAGARKLRAAFVANTETVYNAFRALLPVTLELLRGVECIDPSDSVEKLRAKPPSRAEKQRLWEKVKMASITHLASAVYIVSLLHTFLSLQMNLLARYQSPGLDAPVQALPQGNLSAATSKRYLELASRKMLEAGRVRAIVSEIENAVRLNVAGISLTMPMGVEEVESLMANVLSSVMTDGFREDGAIGEPTDSTQTIPLLSSPQRWLFAKEPLEVNSGAGGGVDLNYEWLVEESLDLCEVLGFNEVAENNALAILSYILFDPREPVLFRDGETKLPLAQLLARFDSLATSLFSDAARIDGNQDDMGVNRSGVEVALSESEEGSRFAASVFLSGEKSNSRVQRSDTRAGREVVDIRAQGALVTNISESHDIVNDRDADLGLMFDLH